MNKSKTLFSVIAGLLISVSQNVVASDNWDNCASADGYVHMDNGILSSEALGEISIISVKVIQIIKSEKEICTLKQSKTKAIAYMNETTVEEVSFKLKGLKNVSTVILLCERGASGLPASESCE